MEPKVAKIGRYHLLHELGQGGMSTVYFAHDPVVGRPVAIKILPRALIHDAVSRGRFQREVSIISALEHPAIVPVYDVGEQEDQPYLVMRYMKGGSLGWRIQEKMFSLPEAVNLLDALAPAIDKVHKLGIVHRDLKPDNILFDEDNNPYIADFGIAKLTQNGNVVSGDGLMGTLAYASPEHLRKGNLPNALSDIYALGVILFEMVTGELPFRGEMTVEVIKAILHDPVPRLSQLNPALPLSLDAILARVLAKDPAQRYSSAREFVRALKYVAHDAPPKPIFIESFAKVFPAATPHLRTHPLPQATLPPKRRFLSPRLKTSSPRPFLSPASMWLMLVGVLAFAITARAENQALPLAMTAGNPSIGDQPTLTATVPQPESVGTSPGNLSFVDQETSEASPSPLPEMTTTGEETLPSPSPFPTATSPLAFSPSKTPTLPPPRPDHPGAPTDVPPTTYPTPTPAGGEAVFSPSHTPTPFSGKDPEVPLTFTPTPLATLKLTATSTRMPSPTLTSTAAFTATFQPTLPPTPMHRRPTATSTSRISPPRPTRTPTLTLILSPTLTPTPTVLIPVDFFSTVGPPPP